MILWNKTQKHARIVKTNQDFAPLKMNMYGFWYFHIPVTLPMDEPGSLSALIIFLSGSFGLNAHFVKATKECQVWSQSVSVCTLAFTITSYPKTTQKWNHFTP